MSAMSSKDCVRVGNAGGYWGDDPTALLRQLRGGPLDYVTQDFLAEITMSILQKQKSRNPELGYATDFVEQVKEVLPFLEQSGTTIISNAGGINPLSCGKKLEETVKDKQRVYSVGTAPGIHETLDKVKTKLTSTFSELFD